MMLQRGAPISAKTKNGLAPLHMASQVSSNVVFSRGLSRQFLEENALMPDHFVRSRILDPGLLWYLVHAVYRHSLHELFIF
jgi:hypothetical protein